MYVTLSDSTFRVVVVVVVVLPGDASVDDLVPAGRVDNVIGRFAAAARAAATAFNGFGAAAAVPVDGTVFVVVVVVADDAFNGALEENS